MKRIIAIMMVLVTLTALFVIPASAAVTPAETKVSAKKGDIIEYTLNLTVAEKLVGTDFSVYFDSSELKIVEYGDFNGYDVEKHVATMNPNLKDEFIFVWTNISGQRMDGNALVQLKFEAQKDLTDAHISYYIRYLYPESMIQFTDYKITCTVKVNGTVVADKAAPELEVDKEQNQGYFVNSVTGNGKDANVNKTGKEDPFNPELNPNATYPPTSSGNDAPTAPTDESGEVATNASGDSVAPDGTTGLKPAAPGADNTQNNIFKSAWFWIILGVALACIAGGGYYFYNKNKKK